MDSEYGIYSDKAGDYIGRGYHYGIKIGDTVYDNMTPDGMKLQDWLDDLGLSGEFGEEIIRWDYVDEIFNR